MFWLWFLIALAVLAVVLVLRRVRWFPNDSYHGYERDRGRYPLDPGGGHAP